ncbi:MAG TPA: Mur ligase family protein [Gammaproteobacteria bacterium]
MVTPARRFPSLDAWLAWLETLHPKKIDMSLGRVVTMLERLGVRHPPYKVITVGGTNGKGSCVAMLESIYWHAGYKVGAFTSPHVWRFNERIRVDGADATDEEIIRLLETIEDALGTVTLTYFESSAVAALLHFARAGVDVAVLEVGMGGRLDAVNAVDADAALVASVDVDHVDWLGPDREAIGREKAGIARAGRPLVVGDRHPPRSLLDHAAGVGAVPVLIGRDFDYVPRGEEWEDRAGARWPRPPFGGAEQLANAAACRALVERLADALPVSEGALAKGIRHAYLRGRLEQQTVDGVEWLFDVAHNPAAAAVLGASLERLPRPARTLCVFAAMHDKDLPGVLRPFVPHVDEWHVTRADPQRGATPMQLAEVLVALGARGVQTAADVPAACAAARERARAGDRVLVFGSFHTVGAATAALGLYSPPTRLGNPSATWSRG